MSNINITFISIFILGLATGCKKKSIEINGYFPTNSEVIVSIDGKSIGKSPIIAQINETIRDLYKEVMPTILNSLGDVAPEMTNYVTKMQKVIHESFRDLHIKSVSIAIPKLTNININNLPFAANLKGDNIANQYLKIFKKSEITITTNKFNGYSFYKTKNLPKNIAFLKYSNDHIIFGSETSIKATISLIKSNKKFTATGIARDTLSSITNHKQVIIGIDTSSIIDSISKKRFGMIGSSLPSIRYMALSAKIDQEVQISLGLNFQKRKSARKLIQVIESQLAVLSLMSKASLSQLGSNVSLDDLINVKLNDNTIVIDLKLPKKVIHSFLSMAKNLNGLIGAGGFRGGSSLFGSPFGKNLFQGKNLQDRIKSMMGGNNIKGLQQRMNKMMNNNL